MPQPPRPAFSYGNPAAFAASTAEGSRSLQDANILIIEDELHIAEFIGEFLQDEGCNVHYIVPNGSSNDWRSQLDDILAGRAACDLILLDIIMHDVDGMDLLTEIRSKRDRTELPVVMMTGLNESHIIVQTLNLGANDYVTKPIDIQVTIARIRTHLQLSEAEDRLKDLNESLERRVRQRTRELQSVNQQLEEEIGERKRTEEELVRLAAYPEALRKSEERFRLLAENSSDLISKLSDDGVFRYVSPASLPLLGFQPEALIGENAFDLCHKDDYAIVRKSFLAALDLGQASTHNHRIRSIDGTYKWFETTFNVMTTGEAGQPIEVQAAARDITQRLQLERDLNQSHKMQAIGVLAAGIAHEINTPIQFIDHNTQFITASVNNILSLLTKCRSLVNTVGDPNRAADLEELRTVLRDFDAAHYVEEIPRAIKENIDGINRVSTIVTAMKEFSHSGDQNKAKIPFDLNKSVKNAAILARNEIKYVADIKYNLCDSLPLAYCFADELNQVFLNVLVNAAHAISDKVCPTTGEKGTITVSTRIVDEAVEVSITDTGPGIPEEIQDRIFEPFFTTKDVGKGTGMGLSLVHDVIVSKHGGRLTFETEPGVGTSFIIVIPVGEEEQTVGDE
ncbi:MAG: ATP-binding protein [Lentisphaeria bacterium]|jgi:PAS domain S-box-containing protein|nr:ATP-binding protein [Lentisphaeria bacterium]MDP7740417.1 ATP-binding protein [Lentisphaeria bacterium]